MSNKAPRICLAKDERGHTHATRPDTYSAGNRKGVPFCEVVDMPVLHKQPTNYPVAVTHDMATEGLDCKRCTTEVRKRIKAPKDSS